MPERIAPFAITTDERELDDLRLRLRRTRWAETETSDDWSQGVPLAYLRDLCGYWADEYDWGPTRDRLNRIPQFTTRIDGLDIHFAHVRSRDPDAVPLILTHGWPGSFFEYERVLALLSDEFHLIVPSLPGYGFSGKPAVPGWGIHRIARAWAELMDRLGYRRFLAQGSDWGTSVTTSLALQRPERLLGIHLVPPLAPPAGDPAGFTERERGALAELGQRTRDGSGYSAVQGTRPQTIGYALVDSPAALCAWIVEKIWAWTDHHGDLSEVLSAGQVLDNVTLYWLTRTGASAGRLYWESIAEVTEWFTGAAGQDITVPAGCSVFPGEVPRPSRRWAERRFTNIVYWNEPPRGGHFAAWEQPDLFAAEVRAVARGCRAGEPNRG